MFVWTAHCRLLVTPTHFWPIVIVFEVDRDRAACHGEVQRSALSTMTWVRAYGDVCARAVRARACVCVHLCKCARV